MIAPITAKVAGAVVITGVAAGASVADNVTAGAAAVVAVATLGGLWMNMRTAKTVATIHVLVNSKMDAAVTEIKLLKQEVEFTKQLPAEPAEHHPGPTSP